MPAALAGQLVENIDQPFIAVGTHALTLNGNHIANSGNVTGVFQFSSGVNNTTVSARDNQIYGGVFPAALAVYVAVAGGER